MNRMPGLFAKIAAMCARTASAPSAVSPDGVVVEDDVRVVQRVDRVEILVVPRVVVAADQLR